MDTQATPAAGLEAVKDVVVRDARASRTARTPSTPTTPLLGTLPELDSLAVLELVTSLEDRFGITVDDDDLTGGPVRDRRQPRAFVDRKARFA